MATLYKYLFLGLVEKNVCMMSYSNRIEKISYKHPPIIKKSIDFIENGPVVFAESLSITKIYIYLYNVCYRQKL